MKLIDLSKIPHSDDRFARFLDDVCQSLEFDHASYATFNPISGAIQGFANYRTDWIMHYTRKGLHRIDPTIHIGRKSIAPVDWNRLERTPHFQSVFNDAPAFGVAARGLTVPVRGPYGDVGLMSVTRDCSDQEWHLLKKKVIGNLQVAAVHMHDNVMSSDLPMAALNLPVLSTREREILQWVAEGKTQQDIGDILAISHRTVEVHLRSARTKLGALSTPQAIGRAVGLGMIKPG
ncbi:DNA-binding transcriptional regulator, CsgD family [Roseovarius tolerans]|uniref:DNA-binding transcriptional regulator, CsgD family n=1 Tax=Roseovarius tolerans TaxID=74031 RepID=A0A1H7UCV6_9RHOB|nr:autoinducer binding domain-containing protein [Roseovarius tolerans]SEL94636.1 DNA-binding transcriptional regulator, CsgD family [Roseovarius tolerans]